MAENSNISWCDHTFNPWIGCTRISPACDGCYAAGLMGTTSRFGPPRALWGGPGKGEGTRTRTADSTWAKLRAWNRKASDRPGETFVFCASLADWADNHPSVRDWRLELFDEIRATPNLTYLLLTKRPGMILKIWEQIRLTSENVDVDWDGPSRGWPKNAAIGCTIANQEEADRDIPKLLAAKASLNPAFAFLSMEPLLGPVDLTMIRAPGWARGQHMNALAGTGNPSLTGIAPLGQRLDWVITGGETDQKLEDGTMHRGRPHDPAWKRSIRDQCAAAGVPYHEKQSGEWVSEVELKAAGIPALAHATESVVWPSGERCWRVGKANDPCTLDGVVYDARPEVRR